MATQNKVADSFSRSKTHQHNLHTAGNVIAGIFSLLLDIAHVLMYELEESFLFPGSKLFQLNYLAERMETVLPAAEKPCTNCFNEW